MRKQVYTVPVMEAMRVEDECPFCLLEREAEEHALDFVLGSCSSYMEDDIRAQTDETGFCREHLKKMFQYGNALGNSLILETHLRKLSAELKREMDNFSGGGKKSLIKYIHKEADVDSDSNNVSGWIRAKEKTCYVCDHVKSNFKHYTSVFFELVKREDPEFLELLKNGKGVCIHHLADVLDAAPEYLNRKEQEKLREILFERMDCNLARIIDELEWFQNKFDYRFADADWKNSKDSVQRAMQKIAGGYPADPPYRQK